MRVLTALLLVASGTLLADQKLGKLLQLDTTTPLAQIETHPEKYVGKNVQVRGRVTEVCQAMGCWMNIVDPVGERTIRIKVNDGEIVFPGSAVGKLAIVEGKLTKLELTREEAVAQARHEAEEQGRKFDPKSIKKGVTIYMIQGAGAVIRE
jgi:hypothetical protein